MQRRIYRKRWIALHKKYEKRGLTIFRKRFKEAANKIPFDSLNANNYELLVTLNILEQDTRQAFFDLYSEIGLRHGKKIGRAINKEIREQKALKNFDPTTFEGSYRQILAQWIINNGGTKITSVTEELAEYIIKFISDQMEQGNDIRTIARLLERHINSRSFYRFQIERIVRTETTAAANFGAIQAGESSGVQWEKEWISSNDSRTRRRPEDQFDHFEMDGIRVPKNQDFDVQGDKLTYPGDPKGQPANVINCRCTVAVVPKRDSNGNIVFTTSQGRTITL